MGNMRFNLHGFRIVMFGPVVPEMCPKEDSVALALLLPQGPAEGNISQCTSWVQGISYGCWIMQINSIPSRYIPHTFGGISPLILGPRGPGGSILHDCKGSCDRLKNKPLWTFAKQKARILTRVRQFGVKLTRKYAPVPNPPLLPRPSPRGSKALFTIIIDTKTSSGQTLVGAKSLQSGIRLPFQENVATLGSTLMGSPPDMHVNQVSCSHSKYVLKKIQRS